MRLLFISNVFPNPLQPTRGVFNLDMVRALAREHDVRVVSPIAWTDEWRARRRGVSLPAARRSVLHGIEVEYPRSYYTPGGLRTQYGRFLWLSTRAAITRHLESFAPEAVLGYWAHPDGEVAVRAARKAGVPAIVMVGGSDLLIHARNPARRRCIRKVLLEADAVVAVSQHLKETLLEFAIPEEKIAVVARGVDLDVFTPGDRAEARRRLGIAAGSRVLLWIGRIVEVKGLDVLVDACARLRDRGVEFQAYLVGDGPLRSTLEAASRSRGLADRISFVGSRPHDQLPDWYRAADLTVLPSRSEGIPNVLRESLACGTPFVASQVGGIPELAANSANRLVPPGDAGMLANALAEALRTEGTGPRPLTRSEGLNASAAALTRVIRSLRPAAGADHLESAGRYAAPLGGEPAPARVVSG